MAKKRSSKRQTQPDSLLQKYPAWVWIAGGGVILALIVAGLFYLGYQGQAIANSGIEGLVILPDPGRSHVNGNVDYERMPPVGGPHSPEWLNCGIYDEPVRPENAVHSMEHGAVWLTYRPDIPSEQVSILEDIVNRERSRQGEPLIILSPLAEQAAPIVATAWRVQLELQDAADERLLAFVGRYQRGPFTPELGASCVFGGVMN